jgi:hypothetical protein
MPFNFLNKDKCTRDYYYQVTDIWHRLGNDHPIKQILTSLIFLGTLGLIIHLIIKLFFNDLS